MTIVGIPITNDIIVIASLFIIFFIYALYGNKGRLISFILAFYPATIFYKTFPFSQQLTIVTDEKWLVFNKLAIFLLFFIPISIIIARFVFKESYEGKQYIRAILYALSLVSVILLFHYTVIDFSIWYDFSPQIDTLFSSPLQVYIWQLLALLFLLFV